MHARADPADLGAGAVIDTAQRMGVARHLGARRARAAAYEASITPQVHLGGPAGGAGRRRRKRTPRLREAVMRLKGWCA